MTAMPYGTVEGIAGPISRLVLGSVAFSPDDTERAFAVLDRFRAAGGNALDTARHYGSSEDVIGEWMAARGNREEIVLVGKGAHPHERSRVTRAEITADLTESLRHLRTDHIDLYLLHRDDPAVPVGHIVNWLNEDRSAGRVLAFGGSNWTTERLQAANDYARQQGVPGFSASSPNLALAFPREAPWEGCLSLAPEDRAWYVAHQMPVFSWSSQAQGFFTGRYHADDRSNAEMVRVWYTEQNWARYRRAEDLGRRKGVPANAIALAYVLAQPFPTFAAIGPHTVEELESSLEVLEVTLQPDEVTWLEG